MLLVTVPVNSCPEVLNALEWKGAVYGQDELALLARQSASACWLRAADEALVPRAVWLLAGSPAIPTNRVNDEVLVCDLRYKRPTQTQRAFHRDARVFLCPP
jgi:hypothetical protein